MMLKINKNQILKTFFIDKLLKIYLKITAKNLYLNINSKKNTDLAKWNQLAKVECLGEILILPNGMMSSNKI
jgi:hypothetical protein